MNPIERALATADRIQEANAFLEGLSAPQTSAESVYVNRLSLCATEATLNGRPAQITGYRRDFALVRDKETGLGCEFSWEAVDHVVIHKKGAFQS